jgi:hypothetical protein
MPETFIAEREYLRCEYDRRRPVELFVLGLLLGYAFARQRPNDAIEQLVARLDGAAPD